MERSTSSRRIFPGRSIGVLAVASTLAATVAFAQMPKYSVQVLGRLPGDYGAAFAAGIDNAGDVVGSVREGDLPHFVCQWACAVTWHDGVPTLLTVPGQFNISAASGVNNAGQVAGTAELMMPNNPNRFSKALVWNDGTPTVLNTPASRYIYNQAAAINDDGQVAGWAYTSNGNIGTVPVVWNGVTPTVLDLPQGSTSGFAYGINSNGVVVGTVGFFHPDISVNITSAVVWRGTTPSLLPSPSRTAQAYAINDAGLIVGASQKFESGIEVASAWVNGRDTALGKFEAFQSTYALGVYNKGMIVGQATVDNDHLFRAVLWSSTTAAAQDLNHLVSASAQRAYVFIEAVGINDNCAIVVNGHTDVDRGPTVFVLTLNDPSRCIDGGEMN